MYTSSEKAQAAKYSSAGDRRSGNSHGLQQALKMNAKHPEAVAQAKLMALLPAATRTQNPSSSTVQKKPKASSNSAQTVVQLMRTPTSEKVKKYRKKLAKSSGGMGHKRSPTAYGYFNKDGKRKRQGPHTFSHVGISASINIMKNFNLTPSQLVDTKLLPSPKQANHMIKNILSIGGKKRLTMTTKQRQAYLKQYEKLYMKAKFGKTLKERDANAEKLMELHPAGTYGVDTGSVSHAEIGGKGESRRRIVADYEHADSQGMEFADTNPDSYDLPSRYQGTDVERYADGRANNFDRAANTVDLDEVSDASTDESSDSDMDLHGGEDSE